jgi:hypothetical protein
MPPTSSHVAVPEHVDELTFGKRVRSTVRRVITGDENRRVREHIGERIRDRARVTRRKLVKRARTAVTGDENKLISDFIKEPVRRHRAACRQPSLPVATASSRR